jgi:hypothetical protein
VKPPADEPHGAPRPHRYDLHDHDRAVGRLEWRLHPRSAAGWYLVRPPDGPRRLDVDPAIDELAADERSSEHDWELSAELAAILSTSLALDAAERELHPRSDTLRGRFRRLNTARRYEIYVTGLDTALLGHAVPELPLTAVSDASVLEGHLLPDGFAAVIRRIELLGGRIVAVFGDEPDAA